MSDQTHTERCSTTDNFLTRLSPEIFQRVMTYTDPETMYDLVTAIPPLNSRFTVYSDYSRDVRHLPGVTRLSLSGEHQENRIREDKEIDRSYSTNIVRCRPCSITSGLKKDPSSLGYIGRNTVVIFMASDETCLEWQGGVRMLLKRNARVWTLSEFNNSMFFRLNDTGTLDKPLYRYGYFEYANIHKFRHVNEIKMVNFTNLEALQVHFSNSAKRPVIEGVHAPLLRRLHIVYCNHFPVIRNNTFGSHYARLYGPDGPGTLDEGLTLSYMDALERSPGKLTRACPTTREEVLRDVDFGFDRCFYKAAVHGGPDAIMEKLCLSVKTVLYWRRSSEQLADNKPIVMLDDVHMMNMFIFETLFPEPSVPVLIGARNLLDVSITTLHTGLKLNGLFRNRDLRSVSMCCYEGYNHETDAFDNDYLLIDEKDLWNPGTPREVIFHGCRANMDAKLFIERYINHSRIVLMLMDPVSYLKTGNNEPVPHEWVNRMFVRLSDEEAAIYYRDGALKPRIP